MQIIDPGKLKAYVRSNMYDTRQLNDAHKSNSYCINNKKEDVIYFDVWLGYKRKWMTARRFALFSPQAAQLHVKLSRHTAVSIS